MTKAEQATLETLEHGLYQYLDLMNKGINSRFDDADEKAIRLDKKLNKVDKRLDAHIKETDTTDWVKVAKIWAALLAPLVTALGTYLVVGN